MDKFYIRFTGNPASAEEAFFALGEIKILDFSEHFQASITYWRKSDYLSQWKEGLERIRQNLPTSCFVTSMYHPRYANFIIWWPVYVEGEWAYIHNQILFFDQLEEPFDEVNLYKHIPPREIYSEDGQKISEWSISIEDLETFDLPMLGPLIRSRK